MTEVTCRCQKLGSAGGSGKKRLTVSVHTRCFRRTLLPGPITQLVNGDAVVIISARVSKKQYAF
jgi:hypothetical protein